LLKKKLPARTFDETATSPVLSDDDEMKCVYLVNTCEYCLETIPQLHQQIEDIISDEFVDNVDLKDTAEDMFREVINSSIKELVKSIEGRNEQVYSQQLLKQNWLQFEQVSDTSAYIKTVSQIIQARTIAVKSAINPTYANFFTNKMVGAMSEQFLKQIYRIKRVNETSSHQFQLDLEELKNTLLCLPSLQQNGQTVGKPSDTYITYVNKSITKVERRLKVLSYPLEVLRETYESLVEEDQRSEKELELILTMRGVLKKDFGKYLTDFINKL